MDEAKKKGGSEEKNKGGRKSKYHTHIEPYLGAIQAMMRNGATLEILSQKFNVHVGTLCEYKHKFPEFAEALNTSAEIADMEIENAFYNMAKTDKWAAYVWLKNRQSKRWRDKQHVFQQSSTVVRKDYQNMSTEELEREMQMLETIEPGQDVEQEFDEGGEVH
jgi:hypothetical protein